MFQTLEGDMLVNGMRVAVVASRFNDFITARLLDSAIDTFKRHGGQVHPGAERTDTAISGGSGGSGASDASGGGLTVLRVPGSFELPLAALKLAQSRRFDAVVCLGCVIRGQTDHYDLVVREAARGIAEVSLQTGVPTVFGVVTAGSLEQAIERAGAKQGNQGAKAMLTAIEMVNVLAKIPKA